MRILEKNGRITEGKILYKGQDIAEFSENRCGSSVENAVLLFSRIP